MKRHFLALDLKGNPAHIAEYVRWHHDNLPEIRQSFLGAGVVVMDMNQFGNKLFTIM
ncbi:L-rhamnose mutarotase [Pontibacter sp. CAU 1760]